MKKNQSIISMGQKFSTHIITFCILLFCLFSAKAQENHWHYQIGTHDNFMAVTGLIYINGVELQGVEDYQIEIACFIDGACRGTYRIFDVGWPGYPHLVFSNVYGSPEDNGKQVSYKVYDHAKAKEYIVEETLVYEYNGILGAYPNFLEFTITTDDCEITNEFYVTVCEEYVWDCRTYDESGTYPYTYQTDDGCDSIVTLHLTINKMFITEFFHAACESYHWGGSMRTTSGEHVHIFQTVAGCDSIVTLHLTINESATSEFWHTACDTYTWDGGTHTASGDYMHTYQTVAGCDSIVTLHLTINESYDTEFSITACGTYTWAGGTHTASGDYTYTFTAVNGCDSLVTLHLTIDDFAASEFWDTACDTYTWDGGTHTTSGDYMHTYQTVAGCDSIVTLHLTITPCLVCPATVYDAANSITYNVVELVGKCWFKENIRGTKYQDGTDIPFAKPYYHPIFPDSSQYKIDFGLLYTFASAFPEPTRAGERSICPEGWRIPTSSEWASLNMHDVVHLKHPDFWLTPNDHTNNTGADMRAAGKYNGTIKRFENLYGYTAWWSSDDPASETGVGGVLRYNCNILEIMDITKTDAISVRCIME